MADDRQASGRVRSSLTLWLPLLAMAGGAALTVLAWNVAERQVRSAQRQRFDRSNERLVAVAQSRFASAEQLVVSLRAALLAGSAATPAQWSQYVTETEPYFREGVVGAGFVERVRRSDLDALERRLRAEFGRPVPVERTGARDLLYVVTRIEPVSRNAGALGLDVGSGNTRRLAADLAMQTNRPVLTQRIRVIEGDREVPGFLLFLPVYDRAAVIGTAEQRSAALRGWVYASLRMNDLVRGMTDAEATQIDVSIQEDGRDGAPLYSTQPLAAVAPSWPPATTTAIEQFGRTWTFHFTPRQGFATGTERVLPQVVAGGGAIVTLLTAGLLWALAGSRRRALTLATRMTQELSAANASLETSIEQARRSAEQAR